MKTNLVTVETENRTSGVLYWIALAMSLSVLISRATGQFIQTSQVNTFSRFTVLVLPLLAALCVLAMILSENKSKFQRIMNWSALLMSIWIANKLPFDFLTMAGLIGDPSSHMPAVVDWSGFITRSLALVTAVILGRMALSLPADVKSRRPATWYGFAAFVFALPYPLFRILWAFGATPGLSHPGAGGKGFSPLILAIPWALAAILSLLLVTPKPWKPRRFLLTAGWIATAIVATIGPAGCWALVTSQIVGTPEEIGIAIWVFYLFYGSWFLWAITAGAATRSYQLRSIQLSGYRGQDK